MTAFAIANFIIWIGNIFRVIILGEPLLPFVVIDLDLGLLLIALTYLQIFYELDEVLLTFNLIGWIISAIYTKRSTNNQDFNTIMIYAAILPALLFSVILFILAINITFAFFGVASYIILAVIILSILLNIVSIGIALPGIFLGSLLTQGALLDPVHRSIPNYLTLAYVPPTPNEPILYCPFRMKSNPGCAFLGYIAPNRPLICDYETSWRSCYIYSHIFTTLGEKK
jgi:hypothetical protein